jgi:Arc/MetJ family transcription regulator
MRTTITLDDALLAQASEVTGMRERSALIHEGLRALVQREAARALIALGGSDPKAKAAPRRRA